MRKLKKIELNLFTANEECFLGIAREITNILCIMINIT